jgi:hypothetical protein
VHAVDVTSGDGDGGTVSGNQLPAGVTNSATEVGPVPALDVPTAMHQLLGVQLTLVNGTEILRAGVPLSGCTASFAVPQLAKTTAPSANVAARRQFVRRRVGDRFINPLRLNAPARARDY